MRYFLILITTCFALTIQAQNFRNAQWGESVEQVKMGESSNPMGINEFLSEYYELEDGEVKNSDIALFEKQLQELFGGELVLYRDMVAGFYCYVMFLFNDKGQLYRAGYIFPELHVTDNMYLRDYEDINEILVEKYGDDFEILDEWFDDQWKDSSQDYGYAIKTGDVIFERKWTDPDTTIHHILSGGDYQTQHLLLYKSTNFTGEDVKSKF